MAKSSSSNGGIGGSGVFGLIGTTVHCQSTDNSAYCTLVKFVNALLMLMLLAWLLYLAYTFLTKRRK